MRRRGAVYKPVQTRWDHDRDLMRGLVNRTPMWSHAIFASSKNLVTETLDKA